MISNRHNWWRELKSKGMGYKLRDWMGEDLGSKDVTCLFIYLPIISHFYSYPSHILTLYSIHNKTEYIKMLKPV